MMIENDIVVSMTYNIKYIYTLYILHSEDTYQNMWVFNLFLKMSIVLDDLTDNGRLFQYLGAAAENDLSPYVFNLVLGIQRREFFDDLRFLDGDCLTINSFKYSGAISCRQR